MIIEIRRHGDWDKNTGELTLKSKKEAKRLSRDGKNTTAFSAAPFRCQKSAEFISGKRPVISSAFNDILPGENIRKRIQNIILVISSINSINASDKVLVLTHNNLIAAIEYFLDGKEIPQNLNDLPVIPHLGGIRINISKQKI